MGTLDGADSGHFLSALVSCLWAQGAECGQFWRTACDLRSPAHQDAGQSCNLGPGDSGNKEAIA